MVWEELALLAVQKGLEGFFKGEGGQPGISVADFQAGLDDAVEEIKQSIATDLLNDRLSQLTGRLHTVDLILREYIQAGGEHRLNWATTESAGICCDLRVLNHAVHPTLTGWPGHTLFMVAASQRRQIIQKRVDLFGANESMVLKQHINESIEHALFLHHCWKVFNASRFSEPYAKTFGGPYDRYFRFYFTRDGQEIDTGVQLFLVDGLTAEENFAAHNAALDARNADIESNWQQLRIRVVKPSEIVVSLWNGLRGNEFAHCIRFQSQILR